MLDFIYNLFKKEQALANSSIVFGHLADIVALFEEEYTTDQNAKNAAIDAVIKILESQKTKAK
jgi:hypothetical protein